jgi:Ca2+-binding RTX toxin-like protein
VAYAKSGSVPEVKVGASITEVITWSSNDYLLVGSAGTDYVNGANGNDILDGVAGNDYLQGGAGNDVYLFRRGSGQDSINNYDTGVGKKDALQFSSDIASYDVHANRNADNLILSISGTTDKVTISSYFSSDATSYYKLEEIRFADGTVWTIDRVKTMVQKPTAGNDLLYGYSVADVLSGGDGNDSLYGKGGDDILIGDGGADVLYGEDGADVLKGGFDNDYLNGGSGNDQLLGQDGNDALQGDGGDDVLDGGSGNDTLYGGASSDLYLFGRGSGHDSIENFDYSIGKADAIRFASDVESTDVVIVRSGADLVLSISGTVDTLTIRSYFDSDATGSYKLEEIRFADGALWTIDRVKAMVQQATAGNDFLIGYSINDLLSGGDGNDTIYGFAGDDILNGDAGGDWLYGDNGADFLCGGSGADVLNGGLGNDFLVGQDGNDVLRGDTGIDFMQGGAGNDYLSDWSGVSLFDGGTGSDTLTGGAAIEVYIGGYGNDILDTGADNDLILFNKGDGQDTFAFGSTGSDTLSIGGLGLSYDELSFSKFGNDLVLRLDEYDQITFKFWYTAPSVKPLSKMQIIAESMSGFVQGGSDPLKDQKIETFDFKGLVGAFDQARAANPGLTSWGLGNSLDAFQTGGSDMMALGGDIAYQYGTNGSLDLVGKSTIFDVMSYAGFGIQPQPFSL